MNQQQTRKTAEAPASAPGTLPSAAKLRWRDRLLPRRLRRHRLQLRVELTQAGATGLDTAALLGLGHDRDRLLHDYFAQCRCLGRAECHLVPGEQSVPRARVSLSGIDLHPLFAWYCPPGQEHLFDLNGYAPGIYEVDAKGELTLLALIHEGVDVSPHAAVQVIDHGVEEAQRRAQHGQSQSHRLPSVHALSLPPPAGDGTATPVSHLERSRV